MRDKYNQKALEAAYDPASSPSDPTDPTDPMYTGGQQWHLNNPHYPASDINVTAVWDDYRGDGVKVAVIDDGIEYSHPDLAANSDPSLGANFVAADTDAPADGSAYLSGDNHGTLVAGVIAADDNDLYGVGVAPDATLASLRIGFGASGRLDQIQGAIEAAKNFDIANNSWSYSGYFYDNFNETTAFGFSANPFAVIHAALIDAVDQGRDGLGTVFTFAAGNYRAQGQDVNYHGFQSSPYTVTVGGHTKFDSDYSASTLGAAILVSGPAQSVRTTDRAGSAGGNSGDTAAVSGTSVATPAVAGVIALMLDANPELGYRDVQEILSLSSKMIDPNSSAWAVNRSDNWNGGGRHVSHEVGYGAVDAFNAVRLAETWDHQATYENMVTLTAAQDFGGSVDIGNGITSTLSVGDAALDLDQVIITVDMMHEFIGDLVVTLESPSGTVSTLMNRPGLGSASGSTGLSEYQFSSVQFWDESIAGDWTLSVQDLGSGGIGNISGWSLDFLGDLGTGDDTYFYSNEWATYGGEVARGVVQDAGGVDALNFAMIAESVAIDLAPGTANGLLGHTLTIDANTLIENVVAGDGNDTLIGNIADNELRGMRGDDLLEGKAGNDTVDGGDGDDTARFSLTRADYEISEEADGSYTVAAIAGSDGTDRLLGIEFLAFADGIYAVGNLAGGSSPDPSPIDPTPPADLVLAEPDPTVVGTSAGGETVTGAEGDDVLASGGGYWDRLAGGLGDDAYVVEISQTTVAEAYGGGNDTVYSRAAYLAVSSEVENFVLLEGAETLLANRFDNHIVGNDGANRLIGVAGNDTLLGMGGDDRLVGGLGDDALDGGAGIDTAEFSGNAADYAVVELADGITVRVTDTVSDDGTDLLTRIEILRFADGDVALNFLASAGAADDLIADARPDVFGFHSDTTFG